MVLVLVGPNGRGKSTLLKTANGLLPYSRGQVLLDGVPLEGCKPKYIAQRVAYLPQSRTVPDITARSKVLEAVMGVVIRRTETESGWRYYYLSMV